jgi:DNA-binding winged helix-turn-helix (wHTH) protein
MEDAMRPPAGATEPARVEAYAFGPFELDVEMRQLRRDGEPVTLSGKVLDMLVVLVRRRHATVAKDELMSAVWPDSFVSEDSLTQNISTVRRVLGDETGQPTFIATVPRRGYRFIAPVTDIGAAPPAPVAELPPSSPVPVLPVAPASPTIPNVAGPITESPRGVSRLSWSMLAAASRQLAGGVF